MIAGKLDHCKKRGDGYVPDAGGSIEATLATAGEP
jgi:hypothetical protein